MLRIKRIYAEPARDDGFRVLVDRLWPRGVSKERAKLDLWLKEIAPSPELRTWFGHDPKRWKEFQRRYIAELNAATHKEPLRKLKEKAADGDITLLYGAHDEEHNGAVVLKRVLERRRIPNRKTKGRIVKRSHASLRRSDSSFIPPPSALRPSS